VSSLSSFLISFTFSFKTCCSCVFAFAFGFLDQLSEMYEFRSTNLQSVKDRLVPFLWQDITGLEAVCYQIVRTTLTGDNKLWG
jgi:hypothetical protein